MVRISQICFTTSPNLSDQLPKEIKKIILMKCDDKTRRVARLACTEWFKFIDYHDYTMYLTKKSDWPQIVDRLCSYSKPMSLRLRKNIIRIEDINEHIFRLTNLTALEIDCVAEESRIELLKLTVLSQLQSIDSHEFYIPMNLLLNLPNLKMFNGGRKVVSDEALARSIQRLTNLERCTIQQYDAIDINLFERYQTTLTSLCIYAPGLNKVTAESWFANLGGLKQLDLGVEDEEDDNIYERMSLRSLTLLESLVLRGLQFHELNSKHVTHLELINADEQAIAKEIDNLINVKHLSLKMRVEDHKNELDLQWLTAMTALEYLNIYPIQYNALSYITSTNLTCLNAAIAGKTRADLDHLTKFSSLTEFSLDNSQFANTAVISTLTQLNSLSIMSHEETDTNFISALSNLTFLSIQTKAANVSHLPNLERLELTFNAAIEYTGFVDLPKLTQLKVYHFWGSLASTDYSFITLQKSLKYLSISYFDPHEELSCQMFSALTSLEHLEFPQLKEPDYEHLAPMTNLTALIIGRGSASTQLLLLPTSLQVLEIGLGSDINEVGSSSCSESSSDDEGEGLWRVPKEEDDTANSPRFIERVTARLPNLYKCSF